MNENEINKNYVTKLFHQQFEPLKLQKIALYGTSNHSCIILDTMDEYNIVGVFDGYTTEGSFCGKPILDLNRVSNHDVDIIIIVARASSTQIIWNRIKESCRKKKIKVYDMHGNILTEERSAKGNLEKIPLSLRYIKEQILHYDIISFDIFGTLLRRDCTTRENIYRKLAEICNIDGDSFVRLRMQAEHMLADVQPYLWSIYEYMIKQGAYDRDDARVIYEQELKLESEVLRRNDEIYNILEYALQQSKPVVLVSDMYLEEKQIRKLLEANGIKGYQKLFVSCEYHTGKQQGLFAIMKEQIKAKSYLHIGDDEDADGIAAQQNGIDAILLKERTCSSKKECFPAYHSQHMKLHITNAYQIGYCLFGELLSMYVAWLINKLRESQYDGILFLARDGFVIKQMYDKVRETEQSLPESSYFLFSRSAGREIMDTRNCSRMSIPEQGLFTYIRKAGLEHKRLAIMDLVSSGTCQMFLNEIWDRHLDGYYLMRLHDQEERKEELQISSFIQEANDLDQTRPITQYYLIMESLIKSTQGTVSSYARDGNVIFKISQRTKEEKKICSEVQRGILAYFDDYLDNRNCGVYKKIEGNEDRLLGYFDPAYFHHELPALKNMKIMDEFRNRVMDLLPEV